MTTLYFLGAGATRADHPNAPLGDDLLHVVLRDGLASQQLLQFLTLVFVSEQVDTQGDRELRPRLDDVFTLLESALAGRAPSPNGMTREALQSVRRDLVAGMAVALERALGEQASPAAERLAAHLRLHPSTVISTNYDIIIDNALLFDDQPNVNYGVALRTAVYRGVVPGPPVRQDEVRHFRAADDDSTIKTGSIRLLKLHGSLNWLYCPRCDEADVFLGVKAAARVLTQPELGRCVAPMCTGRYEVVLVGPSLEQRYDNRILRATWAAAEQALAKASDLVIIGYSLPEADYLIRGMLARHFGRRSDNVTVVDRGGQGGEPRLELKDRYRRLFLKANFVWEGFEGYVRQL